MTNGDPVVSQELPLILQIFQNERWLESERRGCSVLADDPIVRDSVCRVIMRIGAQMRAAITAEIQRRQDQDDLKP